VQTGVSRQGTVVKIDGAQTGQRQDASRDDGEVGNAEQVIEWPTIRRRENFVLAGDTTDLLFLGPFLDHIVSDTMVCILCLWRRRISAQGIRRAPSPRMSVLKVMGQESFLQAEHGAGGPPAETESEGDISTLRRRHTERRSLQKGNGHRKCSLVQAAYLHERNTNDLGRRRRMVRMRFATHLAGLDRTKIDRMAAKTQSHALSYRPP